MFLVLLVSHHSQRRTWAESDEALVEFKVEFRHSDVP